MIFGKKLGGEKSDWKLLNPQNVVNLQYDSGIPDQVGSEPATHAEEEGAGRECFKLVRKVSNKAAKKNQYPYQDRSISINTVLVNYT